MRAENPSYRRAARLRAALALVVGFVVFSDTSAVASPTTTTTPTTALAPVVEVVDEKTADATTAPEDETAAEAVDTAAATVEDTTTAAAAPAAAAVGLGWNGFSVNKWPSGSWRPYAANSPFNISAGDSEHPSSARIVQRILSLGSVGNLVAGNADTTSDFGHPTYYAQPSDPLFTLSWTGGGPGSAINGMRIRIPDAARAAGGDDGHMTVVQPDGWEYDFWRVGSKSKGGGTMTFSGGGRTRIDGSGLGSGATAANFGNLAGVIRASELAAGNINHALFVVVKCVARGTSFGYGTRSTSSSSYVYPASHAGSACSTDTGDLPPMGARMRLMMSPEEVNALPVPAWKKTILRALAHYGGYIGDTGGPGLAFQFESGTTYTAFGAADPLVTFAKQSGVSQYNGTHVFNMASGVDWARYLRILVPPGR